MTDNKNEQNKQNGIKLGIAVVLIIAAVTGGAAYLFQIIPVGQNNVVGLSTGQCPSTGSLVICRDTDKTYSNPILYAGYAYCTPSYKYQQNDVCAGTTFSYGGRTYYTSIREAYCTILGSVALKSAVQCPTNYGCTRNSAGRAFCYKYR